MAVMHYGALMQNEYVTLLPASLDMALDTPTRDGNASLVLHLACRSSRARADFVKSLLDYGLAVDALDAHGRTPLHYCIQFANVDGVQELLTVCVRFCCLFLSSLFYRLTALSFCASRLGGCKFGYR